MGRFVVLLALALSFAIVSEADACRPLRRIQARRAGIEVRTPVRNTVKVAPALVGKTVRVGGGVVRAVLPPYPCLRR